jgi:signal transduction histidine kinase
MARVRLPRLVVILATGALYFAAARFGLLLALEHTNASPVWPPSGLALIAALVAGRRVWPGIAAGAFLSNLLGFQQNHAASLPIVTAISLVIAIGNTLEAVAGERLFRRLIGSNEEFSHVRGMSRFVLLSLSVCIIAATLGTATVSAAGLSPAVSTWHIWVTWWLGDVAGILVFVPPALLWRRPLPRWNRLRALEALVLAVLLSATTWLVFRSTFPLTFLTLPPLVWASLRFGPRGASLSVLLVSGIALRHTVQAAGPFAAVDANTALLLMQAFVCVIAVTHMSLAFAVQESREARLALLASGEALERKVAERTGIADRRAQELRRLAAELVETEQRERERLSRVLHDHVQQLLVAARLRLKKLSMMQAGGDLAESVEKSSALIGQAIGTLRDLSVQLSPPILQDRGLPGALEWLARDMKDKHGLEVIVHTVRCEALGEATRLFAFEAVRELLFNAAKHAGTSEAIVRARMFPDERLEVEVEDQGRGFEPSGASRARQGIGLFSIQERVRAMGGHFEVDSAPGRGTLIRMTIPQQMASAAVNGFTPDAGPRPDPGGRPAGRELLVLIADDHPVVREGLVTLLHREPGIRVVAQAADGEEAVRMARALKPDVAVLDVSMPRMTGLEAARRILNDLPRTRIIGLSMHHDADMGRAMREAGAAAYLSKDRAAEDLAALIRGES